MSTPLAFTDGGFPSATFSGSLDDLKDAILQYLEATVTDALGTILRGQVGGSTPATNVGPWLDDRTWKMWDGSGYSPCVLQIGDGFYVQLTATTVTANRTQNLQDKDGTIALLSDIYDGRPSINLGSTSSDIDWSTSNNFYHSYSADPTYTMSNSLPGQKIMLALSSTGAHTPVFPDTVLWPGATPPAAQSGVTLILLKNVAGTIYGEIVGNGYA